MNPAAAGGVPYQVPPEPKRWPAILLAAAVHAGLLVFLWAGVSWQNTQPVAVEAEVWDMKVQSAAPPPPPQPKAEAEPVRPEPVPPPPPAPAPKVLAPKVEQPVTPKPPDIALERAKIKAEKLKQQQEKKLDEQKAAKEKAERKAEELAKQQAREQAEQKTRDAAEQKAKEAAEKKAEKLAKAKKAAEEQKALDKAREAEMRRITGAGTTGEAPKSTASRADSGYVASLTSKIKSNIAYSGSTDVAGNPKAVYKIDQLPTGEIISVKKIKSSGIPAYDSAVENAIAKSSPLPKKKDGTVERSFDAIFEMKDLP